MILDLELFHDSLNDCMFDSIASVAFWFNRRCELMFSESWKFSYTPIDTSPQNNIGIQLSTIFDFKSELNCLGRYHGIKLNSNKLFASEAINIIEKEIICQRPVLLVMDSYFCPWDPQYKKLHTNHACLLVGIDNSKRVLYCSDAYYLKKDIPLSYDNYEESFIRIHTFSLINIVNDKISWEQVIECASSIFLRNNTHNAITNLGNDIENYLNISKEIFGYDEIWQAPIFEGINQVSRSRFRFGKSLHYLHEKYSTKHLLLLSKEMNFSGLRWRTIRSMLLKECAISNNVSIRPKTLKDINVKLIEIANHEEYIANVLLNICNKNICNNSLRYSNLLTNEFEFDNRNGEIIHLDLSQHFNNKCFSKTISNTYHADLTGVGEYFLAEGLPTNEIWEIDEMRFKFPKLIDVDYDNISCANQTINLPIHYYNSIMLLGCAEWGKISDNILIHYSSGHTDSIWVKFSDYDWEPAFGEIIAWEGNGVKRRENDRDLLPQKARLFAKPYALQSNKPIKAITLPSCSNLHIFSISLKIVNKEGTL